MADVLLALAILLLGGVVAGVVALARQQRLSGAWVRGLAIVCALCLVGLVVSDWPTEWLSGFWADHAMLSGLLSTVLLAGVVFLTYTDAERREQEHLDESVTAGGFGGIVDHLIDAEVALAFISAGAPPVEQCWPNQDPGSPLKWVRNLRADLVRAPDGGPGANDPRRLAPRLPETTPGWREDLASQAMRRLLGGIRDWSPLIRGSRNGTAVLIEIAHLRSDLMDLEFAMATNGRTSEELLMSLRVRLRRLAGLLEWASGAPNPRPRLLLTMEPLPRTETIWPDVDSAEGPIARRRAHLQSTLADVSREGKVKHES